MKKITWKELCDYLKENHDKKGYVVIKQNSKWDKQYSVEDRTYIVEGNNNMFYDNMISTSIWANNLTGTDKGVRLDWYMLKNPVKEEKWQVEYCYI